MRFARIVLLTAASLALGAASGIAKDSERLAGTADNEWISLTGTVETVTGPFFTLDYGKGDITVEMDDFDWYDENALLPGDRVTVTGEMDRDFYEDRKIEASSVYVDKLDIYYYASAADEEGGFYSYPVADLGREDDEWVALTGTIIGDAEADEFRLDTGYRTLTVDRSDVERTRALDNGDRVTVYGEMDDSDLFEGREVLASSVIVLSDG